MWDRLIIVLNRYDADMSGIRPEVEKMVDSYRLSIFVYGASAMPVFHACQERRRTAG